MTIRTRFLSATACILGLSVHSSFVFGGTVRERALAAVVVAQTIVQLASENPELPDTTRRANTLNPRESQDATEGKDAPRVVPMTFLPASDAQAEFRAAATSPSQLRATIFTGESEFGSHWCPNCIRLKRRWNQGNDQLAVEWSTAKATGPQIYPAIRFRDGSHHERFPANADGEYVAITELDELIELIRRHQKPDSSTNIAAGGFGGSIRARKQIRQAFAWFRDSVGENVKVELQWHRTGGQTFPLLANGDWSAIALFGQYGHVNLSASGSTRLPISTAGFSYRITGDHVTFNMDPITISGLALQLGPSSSHPRPLKLSEAAPAPSQMGLMTVWTIVSVARDLWSLLHPSCDLQLGGSVVAKAELANDVLTIEFDQMPSLRIVALFTFQLGVQRVVITDTNIHVDFSGSRFIKSRDFRVE